MMDVSLYTVDNTRTEISKATSSRHSSSSSSNNDQLQPSMLYLKSPYTPQSPQPKKQQEQHEPRLSFILKE